MTESFGRKRSPNQYGRTRQMFRQYFRGKIMAFRQTGRSLFKGILGCLGSGNEFKEVF